jgi:DNA polymerase III alpha subunit (gram-positive type)
MNDQLYIVVDIETNGPAAGTFSMISLGAVVVTKDKEIDSFYQKLSPLPALEQSALTMDWWTTQPKAWKEATGNARPAADVMYDFVLWVEQYNKTGIPIFVSHPIAFDYPFINWYLWQFCGYNPFATEAGSPQTLDLASYASGKLGLALNESSRSTLATEFMKGAPLHNHRAIDDARGYGILLQNLLRASGPK